MRHFLVQFNYNGKRLYIVEDAESKTGAIDQILDIFVTASNFLVIDSCINFEGVVFE